MSVLAVCLISLSKIIEVLLISTSDQSYVGVFWIEKKKKKVLMQQ